MFRFGPEHLKLCMVVLDLANRFKLVQWTDPDQLNQYDEKRQLTLSSFAIGFDICLNTNYNLIVGVNSESESLSESLKIVTLLKHDLTEIKQLATSECLFEEKEIEASNDIKFAPNWGKSYELVASA